MLEHADSSGVDITLSMTSRKQTVQGLVSSVSQGRLVGDLGSRQLLIRDFKPSSPTFSLIPPLGAADSRDRPATPEGPCRPPIRSVAVARRPLNARTAYPGSNDPNWDLDHTRLVRGVPSTISTVAGNYGNRDTCETRLLFRVDVTSEMPVSARLLGPSP